MPNLNSEQKKILRRIVQIAKKRGESPMEIKAAVETGLVESNLRNLSGGDADSAGWRQERASLYKDPTNLDASINRFFDETSAVEGKYGSAGALAAAVQRPAAQYRGRYQQRSGDADALLRGLGGGGSADAVASSVPSGDGRKQLLLQYLQQRGQPGALAMLGRGLQDAQEGPSEPVSRPPSGTPVSGGTGKLLELFYDPEGGIKNGAEIGAIGGHTDHVHVAAGPKTTLQLAKMAERYGLTVRELEPYDKVDPVHTGGSYHYRGQAADVSGPASAMAKYYKDVKRLYGL